MSTVLTSVVGSVRKRRINCSKIDEFRGSVKAASNIKGCLSKTISRASFSPVGDKRHRFILFKCWMLGCHGCEASQSNSRLRQEK